ncbi:MAG: Hpt domain-containing protein [Acidobacteriota bacterium]|nr:Hpt domain-containing protein [Acidobacteriota bacterium]
MNRSDPMIEDAGIIREFLTESNENLDQLDRDLVLLEKNPCSPETLGRIFRTIHTIKGATGFLGFSKLESVAHAGEGLLSSLRDGKLALNPAIVSGLLAMVDAIRAMLRAIDAGKSDGNENHTALIQMLKLLQENKRLATDAAGADSDEIPVPFGQLLIQSGEVSKAAVDAALAAQQAGDPRRLGEILVERGCIHPLVVKSAIEEQHRRLTLQGAPDTVRVGVIHLDRLAEIASELVASQNQIAQSVSRKDEAALQAASTRLGLLVADLGEAVAKTRLQPIDSVWSKIPRMVRDLSTNCGKLVRVVMEGNETELDKTIIEAIKDPLTHIVRNAVDHGIEVPERRIAAGKPAEGILSLRAFQDEKQVNIEVSDDGAGIDIARLKRRAVERGIISKEQAAAMKDQDAVRLIFLPGFSTAPRVTNVSGRGVGMDVVRTNIGRVGGTVDVQTALGAGSTLKIRIPVAHCMNLGLSETKR